MTVASRIIKPFSHNNRFQVCVFVPAVCVCVSLNGRRPGEANLSELFILPLGLLFGCLTSLLCWQFFSPLVSPSVNLPALIG